MDKQQLLNDEQIRHFIVNGYVDVTADVPTGLHETIYHKTDALFAGALDFRGDRAHNPLNNILPLVPELQVVLESPAVRGALTSILGDGYVMHPHRHCHPNFAGSEPNPNEAGVERLMMPLHKDGHAGGKRPRHRTPRWAILFYYPQPCLAEQGPTCIIPGTQYLRGFMHDGQHQRHEQHAEGDSGTRRLPENYVNRNLVPMSGELGTVWIMHFDMVHSFLQNYASLNRYGMKFVFMRTEQPTAPSWHSETDTWAPPEINHVPYDAEILWTYMWNWMYGKTDLYETGQARASTSRIPVGEPSQSRQNTLIAALKSSDAATRMEAANELGFLREDAAAAVPSLIDALADAYEPVQRNALYALGAIGEPAVAPLAEALAAEQEAFEAEPILHICDAAHGLAAIGAPAVPALKNALVDKRENVRASAAYALGEMGPDAADAVDTLIRLLTDASDEVRRHAISALGMIQVPTEKTVPALIGVLENREDLDLGFFAAQALTRIGPAAAAAIPVLAAALQSESAYVRGFSAEALSRIGTAEALQALVPFLRTARWFPYVQKNVTAFSIPLKDADAVPKNAAALTKTLQEWAAQKAVPLPKTEEITQASDTEFQLSFADGRRATARVEGDMLNLYHKRRVEAGFKAYR